ncbi:MAG: DUF928 domain-containing protein [Calothrix sp. SM1_7_51]|nr:DUF928 domain-containing protein [Calothrix sp. SM1_7_51]
MAITPQLQNQLQAKSKDYLAYAENNIWHETITNLVQFRRQNPQDTKINKDWDELLKAVGLQDLAEANVIEEYRLK